jgi:hypothetical protein
MKVDQYKSLDKEQILVKYTETKEYYFSFEVVLSEGKFTMKKPSLKKRVKMWK